MLCAIAINTLVGFFLFRDQVFTWSGLWPSILMSVIISFIYTLLEAIRNFTGKSVILNVLLGRYHRAIQEDIVLMFIDLKASTPTAEKLGSVKFFHFLNEFHEKVEACARYFDGTIYKYLGDGQIIIWPKLKADLALEMILSLDSEFKEIQPQMAKRFQQEINYTAGIHSGICLVGEIGTERKEIGYWGDTINTAQRIQDLCKEYQTNLLFSEPFYQSLSSQIKQKNNFNLISEVKLRGKQIPISLYSLNNAKSDIPH
jgi:adenylate cyclase